jgi:hypothetical protein
MSQQLAIALYTASTWVIPLIIAITFHEASLMGASMSASGQLPTLARRTQRSASCHEPTSPANS